MLIIILFLKNNVYLSYFIKKILNKRNLVIFCDKLLFNLLSNDKLFSFNKFNIEIL